MEEKEINMNRLNFIYSSTYCECESIDQEIIDQYERKYLEEVEQDMITHTQMCWSAEEDGDDQSEPTSPLMRAQQDYLDAYKPEHLVRYFKWRELQDRGINALLYHCGEPSKEMLDKHAKEWLAERKINEGDVLEHCAKYEIPIILESGMYTLKKMPEFLEYREGIELAQNRKNIISFKK